jgi:tetratricopeptide (TPR) repeat protein
MLVSRYTYILLITIFSAASKPLPAQKVFDFNTRCRQAYHEIVQLKLSNGQQLLNAEKTQHPNNLVPFFLENYIDFFTLFFNEDPAEYKKRLPNLDKRLALMNQGPKQSPFHLFTRAVIHFQWAAIRVKFGHNWDAGWEFRRSFLQVKENAQSFPDFSPNHLYRGAMQVAAGSIPDGYKWLSNLLGISGSIKNGMATLNNFLQRTDDWSVLFHDEAVFYNCYLMFYIGNDKEGVFKFIGQQQLDVVNNYLFAFLATNLHLNNQEAQKAEQIINNRNTGAGYLPMPVWDMEMGYAKLHRLDPDAATYLERFLATFKGKFYVKDVLQKLSWHYYLQGNQAKAEACRQQIKQRGSTDTEADKQAQKEAGTDTWPNKLLLQARLLNDGGYYRQALALLHGKTIHNFSLPEEKVEFSYRAGRLYDDLGLDSQAIVYYKQAVDLGVQRKEYFAARAALQTGFIFEQWGDKSAAIQWFQRCLDMEDHDFKNSLDSRAKAGIARCNNE